MPLVQNISDLRDGKPAYYPDQAIYAEFAARSFGLEFMPIAGESGLAFAIASGSRQIWFGGGRCSYFPQNNATAATLAADKYLSAIVLEQSGVPTLGGTYVFLTERHRAHRAAGHERADAVAHLRALGGTAFVKPLTGSRGDFAQAVTSEAALHVYLDAVAQHHDSIIMQPIVSGDEYRIVVLDEIVLYSARKQPPFLIGDGVSPLRSLLAARQAMLLANGISGLAARDDFDAVLAAGERLALHGPMNRSAGGDMVFADPPAGAADLALKAVRMLGLRAGGVDLFTGIDDTQTMRVIEINANPSIRFLEDSHRDDLILAIWRHTFTAMGLLDK